MSRWTLTLEPQGAGPLFLRIARGVMRDIRRGRLVPGQRLPGSRSWAQELGLNRNTVLAAVAELEAQGWVTTTPTRGTFVSDALPEELSAVASKGLAPLGIALPPEPDFLQARPFTLPPEVLHFSAGTPDPRLVPVELHRAHLAAGGAARRAAAARVRRARRPSRAAQRAGADGGRGARRARHAPRQVVVTRGSQMALDLLARAVLRPGEAVAVEALGYRPAWEALRLAGAQLVPVPVDGEGLQVEALERLARAAEAARGVRDAAPPVPDHGDDVGRRAGWRCSRWRSGTGCWSSRTTTTTSFTTTAGRCSRWRAPTTRAWWRRSARSRRCSRRGCGWASWSRPPRWPSGWCGCAR